MTKLRVLDLFCGAAGGWSLGLHNTGAFETVAACEFDPWRRERFLSNNPGVRMYNDVRTLTAEQLWADGIVPDIVVGSPPCQDISSVNWRGQGVDGERSGLFFEAIRIIARCRPRWACLENSANLRNRGADRVLSALETVGYTVWPLVVGAGAVGAPHDRKRSWLVAYSDQVQRWPGIGEGRQDGADRSEAGDRCASPRNSWSGGFVPAVGVADGLPGWLANRARAAYGDAVSPVIAELIGRAILHAERVAA